MGKRTSCVDKSLILYLCQEGVGEVSEELFQEACDTIDVVVEIFWVAEINSGCICFLLDVVTEAFGTDLPLSNMALSLVM